MKNLDTIYIDFIEKFKIVLLFISKSFGDKEILIRKNNGSIQNRNLEITNSKVKGYIFHGSGCDFRFAKGNIDVEFANDNIGFTDWSFYSFVKNISPEITEEEIKDFLNAKVKGQELKFNNKIYEINE